MSNASDPLEAEAAPDDAVYDLLQSHVPKFVKFSESDRLLQDEYDLNQVAASVPNALENLLWLAGISVSTLRSAASTPDQGASLQSLLDKANEKLRQVFHTSWQQSTITVFLRADTHPATSVNVLRILMRSDPGGYASIASSSDGMKTFVALRAFIARHSYKTKPVLLLDEAESHLHYDAQADLVKVFTRQDVATQVIYSTHSAGCLPPDLGTAIKPVAPVGPDQSTIRSSFWTEGPGLNTLMLALGSTTFAFTPSRYAVVGEGSADVVLLPSLLRAVTGQDELDFQVVPGTSELTASQIVEIDAQAQHVVYLVDSDNGGKEIAAGLRSAGVSTQSIVELGLGTITDLTLEDLVDRHTYAAAINEELSRSGRSETIIASELPEVRRSYYVSQRFKDIGVKPPNKILVAARIAEFHEAGPRDTTAGARESIVDASRVEHLRKLYAALATCLGLAEPQ